MRYIIITIFILSVISCSRQPSRLEQVLMLAGENRPELEKVLNHYENPADSLKYKAALFLIENMPGKFGYNSKAVEKRKKALEYLTEERDTIPIEIIEEANSLSNENTKKIYDIDVITSDLLIENIDIAYHQWKNIAWNKTLTFEDFCEYLLPYRLEHEPLESWRREYYNKYGRIMDSIYRGSDVVEAANQLNLYIGKTEKIAYNSEIEYTCLGPLFYMKNKCGDCDDLKNATIYMLRSVGIPAVGHFYRSSPDDYVSGHSWVAIRDTTGKDIAVRYPGIEVSRSLDVEYRKGKIYQKCYGRQQNNPPKNSDVPVFFKNPFLKDASGNYTGKNTFEIHLPATKNLFLYLGVHTSKRTTLIAVSEIEQNKAVFNNVEAGLIYQLFYVEDNNMTPADYPVRFNEDGTIHTFNPDTLNRQTHTIYRKFFIPKWLYKRSNFMIGGIIDCASDENFSDIIFSHQIQDSVKNIIVKHIFPDIATPIRYIRFTSPKSRTIDISEVTFYTKENNSPVKNIHVSGSKLEKVFKNGYLCNISDGNPLTYYSSADTSAIVIWDLSEPVTLSQIEILPRTDDNFIRIGDRYELFYHGGEKGWVSLGTQTAKELYLIFDNIPSNALLWLKNHTRGNEEQVFYFKDGEQMFTGKENIVY